MDIKKLTAARVECDRLNTELSAFQIKNDVDVTTVAYKLGNYYNHFLIGLDGDSFNMYDVKEKIFTNMGSAMRNIKKGDTWTFDQLDMLKHEIFLIINEILLVLESDARELEVEEDEEKDGF